MELTDYNACVKQWADALFRFAIKCTGNTEDARDVVQNSFEVLWQKKADVQADKAKAFVFQVAYRQSIDNYRKQSRISYKEVLPEESTRQTPAGLKQALERALDRLDEQSKALVMLKDYEGYNYEEIGQITGLNSSQVKVYLHRARKMLKDYLVSVENVL
jgi:RNA polymerase sigma-70 factor (ECF subfamily)